MTLVANKPADLVLPPGALLAVKDYFVLYPTRLEVLPGATFDDWAGAAPVFKTMARSSQWWVGDWILAGEGAFGERFAQMMDENDYTEQGLKDIVWVCQRVNPIIRREGLSFEHHRKVAPLDPDEQDYYLGLALEQGLSARGLSDRIAADTAPIEPPVEEPDNEPAVMTIVRNAPARLVDVQPVSEDTDLVAVTLYLEPIDAGALAEYLGPDATFVRVTVTER